MSKSVLAGSFYTPARGGHAPGDLRASFLEAVWLFVKWDGGPEPEVELRDLLVPMSAVCGLLWNCTDTLPRHEFDELLVGCDAELQSGSYAEAARWMKAEIVRQTARQALS
jgi:hypothetical protein